MFFLNLWKSAKYLRHLVEQVLILSVDENRPVFIDFTASWCATCQVNKNITMYPNAALFKKQGVITMKIDYTNKGALINKWLKKYESLGVPLNLLFDGTNPIPIKFPESYSASSMKEALEKIKEK